MNLTMDPNFINIFLIFSKLDFFETKCRNMNLYFFNFLNILLSSFIFPFRIFNTTSRIDFNTNCGECFIISLANLGSACESSTI